MSNNEPFSIILDSYEKECFNLYTIIRSLFNYPEIGEDEELEGKLYASAFAYLCSNYLKSAIDIYEYDDLDLFIEEMDFLPHQAELLSLKEKSNTLDWEPEDFSETVWALIKDYQLKIVKDIHFLFNSQKLKLRLFASIFKMDDSGYVPELRESTLEFFDSNFNRS